MTTGYGSTNQAKWNNWNCLRYRQTDRHVSLSVANEIENLKTKYLLASIQKELSLSPLERVSLWLTEYVIILHKIEKRRLKCFKTELSALSTVISYSKKTALFKASNRVELNTVNSYFIEQWPGSLRHEINGHNILHDSSIQLITVGRFHSVTQNRFWHEVSWYNIHFSSSYNKTNYMHQFLKFIFGIKLYMFRTVPLSTIRSFSLYTQQWYMSYRFADSLRAASGLNSIPSWSCSQAVYKPVRHTPLLCVQWKTPDDGERNCPKHVVLFQK